jgi:hypothetical protein
MTKTWQLEDVSDRTIDAKYTYYLPSEEALELLSVGDAVKIVFHCDVENDKGWNAERMWVQITRIGGGQYEGFLDNDPYYIPDIKAGDLVQFQSKHIIQMSIDDPIPNTVDQYILRCYVTDSILNMNKKVSRLNREEPEEDEQDYSGWTFLSEEDSEEYLNDSKNWHYVSLGAVLNRDNRFIDLLESEFDSEYVWGEPESAYKKK